MLGYIDGVDMSNLESERYWTFPKAYKGDARKETKLMVLSEQYIGSRKQDGAYMRFIKDEDGNMFFQSRSESVNGGYLNKIEWCPQFQDFFDELPNGTCLLGEAYFPNKQGSRYVTTIMGCLKEKALKRQEKDEDKLHYYIFDVWAYNGKSLLNTEIEKRISIIDNEIKKTLLELPTVEKFIERANYLKGEALWEELGSILSSGGEGVVITKLGSKPEPGKRTSRKTLKIKMEIAQTIDAFIDGHYKMAEPEYTGKAITTWNLWYNEKTGEKYSENKFKEFTSGEPIIPVNKNFFYGRAASISLSVYRDGKPYHVIWVSGITDEMREDIVNNPDKLIGKVFEINAMKLEKKGDTYTFRHGKIIQERPDKTPKECDWSQISE